MTDTEPFGVVYQRGERAAFETGSDPIEAQIIFQTTPTTLSACHQAASSVSRIWTSPKPAT